MGDVGVGDVAAILHRLPELGISGEPVAGEQGIVEACRRLDRGRGRAVPKLGNLAGKRFWTSSAAQHYFMASRQGLPRERQRDRAGADRSELHDAAS
jgi:hypothetical protein